MLTAPRELVSLDLAILAVDLASGKPAAVVCDHDSVVLGFPGSAWCIEQILAEPAAARAAFAGLVLACEPARHRRGPPAGAARAAHLCFLPNPRRKRPRRRGPQNSVPPRRPTTD